MRVGVRVRFNLFICEPLTRRAPVCTCDGSGGQHGPRRRPSHTDPSPQHPLICKHPHPYVYIVCIRLGLEVRLRVRVRVRIRPRVRSIQTQRERKRGDAGERERRKKKEKGEERACL